MPTENHIIVNNGTSLHPETNTGQVYDYTNAKWLDQTIADLQAKPSTWDELQGKPTNFPPAPHTHTVSQITDFPDPYELPTASTTVLGGIKPDGTTITVDPVTGVASSVGGNIVEESWTSASLENGWVTGSEINNELLMFYKDSLGRVHIRGQARKGTATLSKMFTLPVGYRPTNNNTYSLNTHANDTSNNIINVELGINSDGSVSLTRPVIAQIDRVYFDISFRAL